MTDILDRAISAHYRYCRRAGVIYDQPARGDCTVTSRRVYLRNAHREVAVYAIKDGRLRRA